MLIARLTLMISVCLLIVSCSSDIAAVRTSAPNGHDGYVISCAEENNGTWTPRWEKCEEQAKKVCAGNSGYDVVYTSKDDIYNEGILILTCK